MLPGSDFNLCAHQIEFSVLNFDFQKMILSHSTSIFCLRTPGSDFNLDSHKIEIQGTEFNFQFFFFLPCRMDSSEFNSILSCHISLFLPYCYFEHFNTANQ